MMPGARRRDRGKLNAACLIASPSGSPLNTCAALRDAASRLFRADGNVFWQKGKTAHAAERRRARLDAHRRTSRLASAAFSVAVLWPATGLAARWHQWEVTFAIRVTGGADKPVAIRLALPQDTDAQRVTDLQVVARGLEWTVVREHGEPFLLLQGKLKGARRLAVSYRVAHHREVQVVPPVAPVDAPTPDLVPFLSAAPLFQSRSILVREFLETHAGPTAAVADADLMRVILAATRNAIEHRRNGKTLVLDVLRRRQAQRIGIERAFTTFLRCARIPARLVEGVNVKASTQRKRVFWTEVWAQNRWWPVSASEGWIGRLPASYVALARDGARVLHIEGAAAEYQVHVPEGKTKPRKRKKPDSPRLAQKWQAP